MPVSRWTLTAQQQLELRLGRELSRQPAPFSTSSPTQAPLPYGLFEGPYLTILEAATYVGVSVKMIQEAIADGRLTVLWLTKNSARLSAPALDHTFRPTSPPMSDHDPLPVVIQEEPRQETILVAITSRRRQVLRHYSQGTLACASCGYSTVEALVLDHVNGDGKAHRETIKGTLLNWLWDHHFPDDPPIQVLCANCHLIKSRAEARRRAW